MGSAGTWTAREIDILEALTLKVRVLTREQLARGWWAENDSEASLEEVDGSLRPLCEAGLVERLQVFAHPLIDVSRPVFHWTPGEPGPSDDQLESLAQHFQERWTLAEEPLIVYVATRQAANLMGSYVSGPPVVGQWTHDIHVAEVFVNMKLEADEDVIRRVIGAGRLPKLGEEIFGMKDPDLFIVNEHGQAEVVIEVVGACDKKQLREFHDHCDGGAHWKLRKRFPDRLYRLYPDEEGTEYFLV